MWLSIRLPQLPLDALQLKSSQALPSQPQAVIQENRILCINRSAQHQGVQVGQSVTNAFALCETIKLYQRKQPQELQLLKNIAILVYRISPSIIIEPQRSLIVEIARSLKLYKKLNSLLNKLMTILNSEHINYQLAIGHSPTSSEILSFMPLSYSLQAVSNDCQINSSKLEKLLSKLSIESMLIEERTLSQFQSVGFKNIGELKDMSHSSIRKRFGKNALNYLLKLFNQQADPRGYFYPEANFYQHLEFNEVIHHHQELLLPVKCLLKNLVNFLHLQQKNTQHLEWTLFDSSKYALSFTVIFSNSKISLNNYLELTQLNLERQKLKEPIEGVALKAKNLNPLEIETLELFDHVGGFKQNNHFVNKIKAKLGVDSCLKLVQRSDHLPEYASITLNEKKSNRKALKPEKYTAYNNLTGYHQHNPTWLLASPKPIRIINNQLLFNGQLKVISPPQKIASNWWNSSTAREYYIAEHVNGIVYWIFFDQIKKRWFLQGIYG